MESILSLLIEKGYLIDELLNGIVSLNDFKYFLSKNIDIAYYISTKKILEEDFYIAFIEALKRSEYINNGYMIDVFYKGTSREIVEAFKRIIESKNNFMSEQNNILQMIKEGRIKEVLTQDINYAYFIPDEDLFIHYDFLIEMIKESIYKEALQQDIDDGIEWEVIEDLKEIIKEKYGLA